MSGIGTSTTVGAASDEGAGAPTSAARLVLQEHPVLPAVTLRDPATVAPLVDAVMAAGIRSIEITLRTPRALEALAAAVAIDGFEPGAGTVLTPADVDRCVDAGARFLLSPGLAEDVLVRAAERGAVMIPGIATASELQRVLRHELDVVKVFPAASLGGPGFLRSLAGPFPGVGFLPSGGVDAGTARDYLAVPSVAAITGTWMLPAAAIEAGDWPAVTRLCREAVALVQEVRG